MQGPVTTITFDNSNMPQGYCYDWTIHPSIQQSFEHLLNSVVGTLFVLGSRTGGEGSVSLRA